MLVPHLHITGGHVVDHGVAEHMRHGVGLADVFTALADDHRQFGFVINLVGNCSTWQLHVVGRAHHAFGHFGEYDGPSLGVRIAVFENRGLQLFGVRMVVAAHAPDVAARHRQWRFELDRRDGQRRGRQSWQGLTSHHGVDQHLGAMLGLNLCQGKRRDLQAIG